MQKNKTGQLSFLQQILIEQDVLVCEQQTVQLVFKNLLEAVLNCKEEAVVLVNTGEHSQSYENLLRRVNFVNSNIISFGGENKFLKQVKSELLEDDINFLIVMSPRYSGALIWSEKLSIDLGNNIGTSVAYTIINSKNIFDIAKNIVADTTEELNNLIKLYSPERRSNEIMNSVISGLIKNLNDVNTEYSLTLAEKENVSHEKFSYYENAYNKASSICHEIKNHLSIIDMYTTIIDKKSSIAELEELKSSCKNACSTIKKSLFSVSFLLNSLKNEKTNIQELDLSTLITNVVNMATPKIETKNIELVVDLSNNTKILADEIKLQNVLLNLVYNAVEAIESKGKIEIMSAISGQNLLLRIKDNGTGICETVKKQLFSTGMTTKKTGNGLGLSICKENISQMNGEIKLVGSDETGTEFEISLPLAT